MLWHAGVVTSHEGWEWVDEGRPGQPKLGYVTTKVAAHTCLLCIFFIVCSLLEPLVVSISPWVLNPVPTL